MSSPIGLLEFEVADLNLPIRLACLGLFRHFVVKSGFDLARPFELSRQRRCGCA